LRLPNPLRCRSALVALALGLQVFAPARGQAKSLDDHESKEIAWTAGAADTRYRVERQARVQVMAHGGMTCEQITTTVGNGSFVYFAHPIAPARVIDELHPSVWLRGDRGGAMIAARVILPHVRDPKSGKAATVIVRGTTYGKTGQWQQLAVTGIPAAVERQARVLRAQLGKEVTTREAYVDQVLVNVYCGQGASTIWLDDLDVAGFVGNDAEQVVSSPSASSPSTWSADKKAALEAVGSVKRIELQNDVLLVGGKPFLPRMIDYRGESPTELAQLGFNTLWLRRPPTEEFLIQVRKAGLWVVCPPPEHLPAAFGAVYDGVLAWNLGHHLSAAELDAVTRLAEILRKRDRIQQRPLVAHADSELRGYSRVVDVLLIDKSVLGTSLEMTDYIRYLAERPQAARPGTPFWSTVELDFDPRVIRQIEGFSKSRLAMWWFDIEQVRQVALAGVGQGSRGLLFTTHQPLVTRERRGGQIASSASSDNQVVVSRHAMALSLLNRELASYEPWITEGQKVGVARDTEHQISAAVLQSRRGKLLVATRVLPGGQFAPGAHSTGNLTLVAAGVAESNEAFELTAAPLRSLTQRRVAGGAQLVWDGFGSSGCAVITSDSLLVTNLNRQSAPNIRPIAAYQMALARSALMQAEAASRSIRMDQRELKTANQRTTLKQPEAPTRNPADRSSNANKVAVNQAMTAAAALTTAQAALRQANQQFSAGDAAAAYRSARKSCDGVRIWQRWAWEKSIHGWSTPVASPAGARVNTIIETAELNDRIDHAVIGRDSLVAGECENLNDLVSAGWRHFEHATAGVETQVELSPANPFEGQSSLHLVATATGADAPTFVETPPVWIVTAPVRFAAETPLRIRGRVRIASPITASLDGLEIIDSLAGPALATRIGHAPSWQEFSMVRIAAQDEPISITFAMTGLGEAWIDDVRIEPVALTPPSSVRPGPIGSLPAANPTR
jgi:hypothetical protein